MMATRRRGAIKAATNAAAAVGAHWATGTAVAAAGAAIRAAVCSIPSPSHSIMRTHMMRHGGVGMVRYASTQAAAPAAGGTRTDAHPAAPASASASASTPASDVRATLLDGVATSETILDDLGASVRALLAATPSLRPPGLAVLLATSSRDSQRYVERKAVQARRVGFRSTTHRFDEGSVTTDALLQRIAELNADPTVDGILVQLPLPAQVSQSAVLAAVAPAKDVDCFHPANVGNLALFAARERDEPAPAGDGDKQCAHAPSSQQQVKYHPWERRLTDPQQSEREMAQETQQLDAPDCVHHVPCTPKACLELLDRYRIPLSGRHVVVLGRSASVGLPLTLLLLNRCATVTNIDQETSEAEARRLCRTADVLVAAVGSPEYIRADWIKPGAAVIDVGINFVPRKVDVANHKSSPLENPLDAAAGVRLVGDVAFDECVTRAGFISPVPGGVGPMTVAMLMDNTMKSYLKYVRQHQRALAATNANGNGNGSAASAPASSPPSSTAAPIPPLTSSVPPVSPPPAPMLFVSGGPGAGKGTQASLLVSDYGADVRGIDGVDSDQPVPRSPSHAPFEMDDGRRYGVVHISVGALLRHEMQSPSPHLPFGVRDEIAATLSRGGILPGHITVQLLRAEVERCIDAQERANPSVTPCFVIDGFPRSIDNLELFEKHFCALDSILELQADEATMTQRLLLRGRSDDTPPIIARRMEGFRAQTMPVLQLVKDKLKDKLAEQRQQQLQQVQPALLKDSSSPVEGQSQLSQASTPSNSSPSVPASAPAYTPAHGYYTVDGRPSVEEVYGAVKPIFKQFLQRY